MWNESFSEDYSREELANLINEPQNLNLATAIDFVDSEGLGFEKGAFASQIGMIG